MPFKIFRSESTVSRVSKLVLNINFLYFIVLTKFAFWYTRVRIYDYAIKILITNLYLQISILQEYYTLRGLCRPIKFLFL